MKHYWMAAVCSLAATWAVAQTPIEMELLSAQKSYQVALSSIQSSKTQLLEKQSQLLIAQQRFEEAKNSVSQLEAEVSRLQAAQISAEQQLQSLGSRLDSAWSAAKP